MIGTLHKIGEKWVVRYPEGHDDLPLWPGPFPLPQGVFIDDVLIDSNEVHFGIIESDTQDRYSNGDWARSYSTVKYAKLTFNHLKQEHNFLPGFVNQFDPTDGELDDTAWTAYRFLIWLTINNFKIVKK